MKSSYELAMERLNKSAPGVKLTDQQKQEIADLESLYKAKVAQREIGLKSEIAKAIDNGQDEEVAKPEQQLAFERKKLLSELEEKKEGIRNQKTGRK